MATPSPKAFADLLASAVHEPGTLSQAYRQFHHYSLGNQLLAMFQCAERGIAPGPINTFPGWKTPRAPRPQGRDGDHAVPADDGEAPRRSRHRRHRRGRP